MSVKQRQYFFPLITKFWQLEAVAEAVHACAEFINLTSKNRGSNRFIALLMTFELLADHPQVKAAGITLPETRALQNYLNAGLPLGNPTLQAEVERTGEPELQRLLDWSLAVNHSIATKMAPVPPFKAARRAIELIAAQSDALVVSQTPEEALIKEWDLHELRQYVYFIAGQEHGTKAHHLTVANGGRYAPENVLLIGDARGDLLAAQSTGACFYPILTGMEESSWERFCDEAYQRFLAGTFTGDYQHELINAFEHVLADTPPWQQV